ncbi:ABC transporter ATP-binding protein [Streptomyces sp.]
MAVRGLVKRYPGDVGVLGVDLDIGRHQVFGLVGPNGAGKTTLLSLLCGLTVPDAGSVVLPGRFALCPDAPEFEPWLTGAEVLRQSFALARPGEPLGSGRLDEIASVTGIETYVRRRCGGYSRGMTQRLGIAAALVLDPDVLVLDEPTSALDAVGRADVLALIRRLSRQRTVLLSSHTLSDVQRVADTIAVMDTGKMLFTGPPQVLIDEYLRPAWRVVLTGCAAGAARTLAGRPEVREVRTRSARELDVEFATVAAGEEHLVPILAGLGVGVTSVAPVDADLESAFLALTGRTRQDGDR